MVAKSFVVHSFMRSRVLQISLFVVHHCSLLFVVRFRICVDLGCYSL